MSSPSCVIRAGRVGISLCWSTVESVLHLCCIGVYGLDRPSQCASVGSNHRTTSTSHPSPCPSPSLSLPSLLSISPPSPHHNAQHNLTPQFRKPLPLTFLHLKRNTRNILRPPTHDQLLPIRMPRNFINRSGMRVLEYQFLFLLTHHIMSLSKGEREEGGRTLMSQTHILPSLDPVARYAPRPGEKPSE